MKTPSSAILRKRMIYMDKFVCSMDAWNFHSFMPRKSFVLSSRSCIAFNPLNQFMGSPSHSPSGRSDTDIPY